MRGTDGRGPNPLAFSLPERALKQRVSVPSQGEKINSARGTSEGPISRYEWALLVGTTKQAAHGARTVQTPCYAAIVAIPLAKRDYAPGRTSAKRPCELSYARGSFVDG
jgi:hypothetical protein